MPDSRIQGLLTDIGTEELGHLEMIAAIIHQLTRNLTDDQLQKDPVFASYFVDHTTGVYPTASSGFPWTAASIGVKGDPICDLTEDLAAEGAMRQTQPPDSDGVGGCQVMVSSAAPVSGSVPSAVTVSPSRR